MIISANYGSCEKHLEPPLNCENEFLNPLLHHCEDPPLKGNNRLRLVNAHWSDRATKITGVANSQKVLSVNYTLGKEIRVLALLYRHVAVGFG